MIGFILSTETWFYRRVLSILVPSDDSALKASEVLFILKKVRHDNDLKIKFSETAEFLMIPWSLYGKASKKGSGGSCSYNAPICLEHACCGNYLFNLYWKIKLQVFSCILLFIFKMKIKSEKLFIFKMKIKSEKTWTVFFVKIKNEWQNSKSRISSIH